MFVTANGPAGVTIEARVIRADGSAEDLGVVAYWDKNPLKRAWWEFKKWFRRFKT